MELDAATGTVNLSSFEEQATGITNGSHIDSISPEAIQDHVDTLRSDADKHGVSQKLVRGFSLVARLVAIDVQYHQENRN